MTAVQCVEAERAPVGTHRVSLMLFDDNKLGQMDSQSLRILLNSSMTVARCEMNKGRGESMLDILLGVTGSTGQRVEACKEP